MDSENKTEHNENYSVSENLGNDQEQRIEMLVDIIKKCEELLIICKDVLKYTPASSIMGKRIDEVLKDISQIGL